MASAMFLSCTLRRRFPALAARLMMFLLCAGRMEPEREAYKRITTFTGAK